MLQSMGSQRVRHNLVPKQQLESTLQMPEVASFPEVVTRDTGRHPGGRGGVPSPQGKDHSQGPSGDCVTCLSLLLRTLRLGEGLGHGPGPQGGTEGESPPVDPKVLAFTTFPTFPPQLLAAATAQGSAIL